MKRNLEPIDLIVAVGLFATVVGGYFFYMAASGALEAAGFQIASVERSSGISTPMDAMEWVQPALGQAIVDNALLERKVAEETTAAAKELNRATMMGQVFDSTPTAYVDQLKVRAGRVDTEEGARIQYVMGRSIVGFTARGIRSGALTPGLYDGAYNRRMIERTDAQGTAMMDAYRETREPMLGWAIVAASQGHQELADQIQHRIGTAITQVAQVQDGYMDAMGDAQVQLASVALASVHNEQIVDRFEQLARADLGRPHAVAFSEPRAWPDIPAGLLAFMSACLVGVFFIGLLTPTMRPEEEAATSEATPEPAPYRKTA
jgi:flagellar basal body-associated protein FliL